MTAMLLGPLLGLGVGNCVNVLVTCRCGSCYAGNKHALMDYVVLVKCVSFWMVLYW